MKSNWAAGPIGKKAKIFKMHYWQNQIISIEEHLAKVNIILFGIYKESSMLMLV